MVWVANPKLASEHKVKTSPETAVFISSILARPQTESSQRRRVELLCDQCEREMLSYYSQLRKPLNMGCDDGTGQLFATMSMLDPWDQLVRVGLICDERVLQCKAYSEHAHSVLF